MSKLMKDAIIYIYIFYWLAFMMNTHTCHSVCWIVGIGGVICLYKNMKEQKILNGRLESFLIGIFASVLSAITILGDYQLFIDLTVTENAKALTVGIYKVITILLVFIAGFIIFWNLLMYFARKLKNFYWNKVEYTGKPIVIFLVSLFLLSAKNIIILFLCYYPGIVGPDAISQINQALNGHYSNHHPFYHTMLIKIFQLIGLGFFNDINLSIALFNVFQIIFMGGCFSFIIVTLYQMKVSKRLIIGCWLWYALMPIHIFYSWTVWKDVMFGGFVAVLVTSMFRLFKNVGISNKLNYVLFVIGSIGMCLFRSNGWFALLLSFFCFIVLLRKKYKKISIIFMVVLFVSYILGHPVLQYINVTQPDVIEHLSIPAQQIARVITDCENSLTQEQADLLNEIIDVDLIPDAYLDYLSDPIKGLVRKKGNQNYLLEHKFDYLKLYIEIGLSKPHKYIQAWVDLTKNFWDINDMYWYSSTNSDRSAVCENDLGIDSIVYSEYMQRVMLGYADFFNLFFLRFFHNVGFYVWIIVGLGILGVVRKDMEALFLTIPNISIIISLLVAAPTGSMRYAYAIFCCIPFLLFSLFYKQKITLEQDA